MKAHYIEIRSIAHSTEDPGLVKQAMGLFLPEDAEIDIEKAEGHFGNPIKIFSSKFSKSSDLKKFLDVIEGCKETVWEEIDNRLDDDCNLWMRFDKQLALNGEVKLAEKGGIIARIKVEAYPAKKENALKNAEKFLND